MLTIRVLQTPQILLDGAPVTLPFKRAEALLYYLLIRRVASRQELIALLWESEEESKGLKNLRHTLYTIKKVLGEGVLISPQRSMIMIDPDCPLESDYADFVHGGELAAYQGAFLSGFSIRNAFAFDEWSQRTREKLRDQYLQGLTERAQAARRTGDLDEAGRLAQCYVREEPYNETMAAFLMECLRDQQQYAKATLVYQQLKGHLEQDLGADPLAETTMLYYEILNQWNDSAAKLEQDQGDFLLAGRRLICRRLQAAAQTFMETGSRRSSQLLVGERGSGKSEVINCFLREGLPQELLAIRTECLQSEHSVVLSAWRQILMQIAEFARETGIALPPQIGERLEKPLALDQSLRDAVALLFTLVGREKKILLILEDLQWADPWSLELLELLLRRLERGTFMAVVSMTRDTGPETKQVVERLCSDGLLHRQELLPLSYGETAQLLRQELGQGPAEELAEQFYEETTGDLRMLKELAEAYRQGGDGAGELDALPEKSRRLAQLLSLFPEGASVRLLQELSEEDAGSLEERLTALCRRSLLEAYTDRGVPCFRFVYRRVREAVCQQIPEEERQRLHAQVAARLETSPTIEEDLALWEQIAFHARRAGDLGTALTYQIRALNQETRLRCEPFRPWPADQAWHMSIPELEREADRCQRELEALSPGELPSREHLMRRVVLIRGRVALFQGKQGSAVDILEKLLEWVPRRNTMEMAEVCVLLAEVGCYCQDAERAERYVSMGLRLMERERNGLVLAQLYRLHGNCFGLRGDYSRGAYHLQEAEDLLEGLEPGPEVSGALAAVYGDMGRFARCCGDYAHAGRHFKNALSLLEGMNCAGRVWLNVHYGRTAYAVDDLLRARELFSAAYETARKNDELWGMTAAAAYCAWFQTLDGRFDQAAQTLEAALGCAKRTDAALEHGILHSICADIRLRLDREMPAASELRRLLPETAQWYAAQGVQALRGIPNVIERQRLTSEMGEQILGAAPV